MTPSRSKSTARIIRPARHACAYADEVDIEERLAGGNAAGAVVRVGATVRKPWTRATPSVHRFMTAMRDRGVDAPEPLGRDERGRQILEFVPGVLAMTLPPLTLDDLGRVGGMVRRMHDAAESFEPAASDAWETLLPAPGGGDLICHGDLGPWNLVIGERWVFIDWDGASPSTRLWDLAYAAVAFTLNDPAGDAGSAAVRLAALVDGYGADAGLRERLPDTLADRPLAMHAMLERSHAAGIEPWGTMFFEGHGEHWQAVAASAARHRERWGRALAAWSAR